MSRRAVLLVILSMLLVANVARAERVTVFAAVSLKEALTDIKAGYERASGDELEFSFGASGQLATQIKEGAPADVFISAAEKQAKELIDAKVADESSRVVIAANRLVLIVPADAEKPVSGFSELADARVKRISIGQPRTVPAGEYATQVLTKLNILDAVRERLVYGTNVRQVLDYVRRGEVDAGIVYATDAASEPKVKVVATADEKLHDPIIYPAVVIRREKGNAAGAKRFLDHLQSDAARQILRTRGFAPTTRPSAP
jgi:molybdate transport system substrate-binding protein